MKLIRILILQSAIIINLSGFGQIMTLDSIISHIKKNNPALKSYDYQIGAYNAYAKGAKNWDAPEVGAGVYMLPYDLRNDMGSVMLSIQQTIPNPSKLRSNSEFLNQKSAVTTQTKNYYQNQLISEAKSLYYDWIISKKKQQVLKSNERQMSFLIQTSESRLTYGKEKLNSIYKAKAALLEVNKSLLMNEKDINEKRVGLNTLMNQDKNQLFDVDSTYVIKNYDAYILDNTSISQSRSDIKAIDQSIQLINLNKKIELSKSTPDFGIKYDNMFGFGNQPVQFTLMGMITIPIVPWASKSYKANIIGLDLEAKSMEMDKEKMVNNVTGTLSTLQGKIVNIRKQLKLYEDGIIPALTKNYQTSLIAYDENTEDLFVVIDAWQTLNMTQLEYFDHLQELLDLQVEFEREIEKN